VRSRNITLIDSCFLAVEVIGSVPPAARKKMNSLGGNKLALKLRNVVTELNESNVKEMLRVDQEQIRYVEIVTGKQRNSSEWKEYRYGRITASVVGAVLSAVRRGSYPKSLFDRLKSVNDLSYVPAVKWGCDHESAALRAFNQLNPQLPLQSRGLVLHSCGIIGGSPDAVAVENIGGTYRDTTVVEIKCPYKYRECMNLYESAAEDTNFCIDCKTRKLKKDHDYWHQVQCLMWVLDVPYAYFVVWIPKHMHVEKIAKDPEWAKVNVPIIYKFYFGIYLPHLQSVTSISNCTGAVENMECD
jgi:YqaJ-like viral recombinase domain